MSVATANSFGVEPSGPKPRRVTPGRIGIYAFLIMAAIFFLLPLAVMILTSMKSMNEIRGGNIFALPTQPTFDYWIKAWSSACTGVTCNGLAPGFFNSVKITVLAVPISIICARSPPCMTQPMSCARSGATSSSPLMTSCWGPGRLKPLSRG